MQLTKWVHEPIWISKTLRFNIFKLFSLEIARPIVATFHVGPPLDRETKVCSNGPGQVTKTYMVKTLKNILFWNQKAKDLERCHAASGTRVLPRVFKWWPWLTLTYFMARSNLVSYAFVWEKGKTMDFSELLYSMISKLVDAVNQMSTWSFMNIKGPAFSFTLVKVTQIQHFQTSFPLKPLIQLKPQFVQE